MSTLLFDTETTGLLVPNINDVDKQPHIIEIYAVHIDEEFNILAEIDTFVKPPIPLPEIITDITKITDSMLKDAPTFPEIREELSETFLGAKQMVAHNVAFDRGMLYNELERIDRVTHFPWPIEHICTAELSMQMYGRRHNLAKFHQRLIGKPFADAHRAKNDVHALVRIWHALTERGEI